MLSKYSRIIALTAFTLFSAVGVAAQDVVTNVLKGYDADRDKLIPDKVFEIGLPLLLLFFIANTLVTIFRIKAENRLKEKAMDKGLSEATLISLFSEDKALNKFVYMKWFLVLFALGFAFIVIQVFAAYFKTHSGYSALGIILIFQSIALLIYYRMIRNK